MVKRIVFLIIWLAATSSVCNCWGENVKEKTNSAQQSAKEKTNSWAGWAVGKLSEGLGITQDYAKDGAQKVSDTCANTVDSAAYETQRYASEKANKMAELTSEKLGDIKSYASEKADQAMDAASDLARDAGRSGKDKASDAYEQESKAKGIARDKSSDAYEFSSEQAGKANLQLRDKASDAYAYASEKAGEANENMKDKASDAYAFASEKGGINEKLSDRARASNAYGFGWDMKDRASDTYEDAKSGVADARDSMTEEAKVKYEATKGTASQVTGDVGSAMRSGIADQ